MLAEGKIKPLISETFPMEKAVDAISDYPDSPIKESLSDLVAFNISRVR